MMLASTELPASSIASNIVAAGVYPPVSGGTPSGSVDDGVGSVSGAPRRPFNIMSRHNVQSRINAKQELGN